MGGFLGERKAVAPGLYQRGWGRTHTCDGGRKRGRTADTDPTEPASRFSKRAVPGSGGPAAVQASSRASAKACKGGGALRPGPGLTPKEGLGLLSASAKSESVGFGVRSHSLRVGRPGRQGQGPSPLLPTGCRGPVTCASRRGRSARCSGRGCPLPRA